MKSFGAQESQEGYYWQGAPKWTACLVFWIVLAVALSFAIYTNHAWEDFYITYRSSKNLALGNGLVFTPGERVQAFTSPLNVLIPAGLSYAAGNNSDTLVLWLFRVISAAALAGAAVLLYQIAKAQSFKFLPIFVLIGLFATNIRIVDFSINGQETGLMMFFLALTLRLLMLPVRANAVFLGIAWAGLMWTRPDGCVYIAIIAGAFFLFNAGPPDDRPRIRLLKDCFLAGVFAAVLYLPWLIWAWSYYGTPIPHTIIAKGLGFPMGPASIAQRTISFLMGAIGAGEELQNSFGPIYFQYGGWPNAVPIFCGYLAWFAAWYWVLPFGNRQTRAVSLAFFLGTWYIDVITPTMAPWYYPNVTIFAIYVLAQIVQQTSDFIDLFKDRSINERIFHNVRSLYRTLVLAIPTFTAILLIASAIQFRIQQREIEDGIRKQIGIWLYENKQSPNDTVFLEPLGYIGYFSGLKMLDYPGLASPEVVALRKNLPDAPLAMFIAELRPDWLVLRAEDLDQIRGSGESLMKDQYKAVKVFDVSKQLKSYGQIPGDGYITFDQIYYVFKKLSG